VRPAGFDDLGAVTCTGEDDFVGALAPAVIGGEPAIVTHGSATVRVRHWRDGRALRPVWTAPDGWQCAGVVAVDDVVYAWLHPRIADDVPTGDRWRQAARLGGRLWDVTADRPVGPPLVVPGYEWGPWPLNGRPVMLFAVNWRDLQAWDLGRREPLGPGLGDLGLRRPQAGVIHGRPVVAGAMGNTLTVCDLGTARRIAEVSLPRPPVAVTIGGHGTVWAVDDAGGLVRIDVTGARIHPSAVRRLAT
jgi:hypothetical protein